MSVGNEGRSIAYAAAANACRSGNTVSWGFGYHQFGRDNARRRDIVRKVWRAFLRFVLSSDLLLPPSARYAVSIGKVCVSMGILLMVASGLIPIVKIGPWLFVCLAVLLLISVLGLGWFVFCWRRMIRYAREHDCAICPQCYYPLRTESEEGCCPECGAPYVLTSVRDKWRTFLGI
jgi:hypothetical protein